MVVGEAAEVDEAGERAFGGSLRQVEASRSKGAKNTPKTPFTNLANNCTNPGIFPDQTGQCPLPIALKMGILRILRKDRGKI